MFCIILLICCLCSKLSFPWWVYTLIALGILTMPIPDNMNQITECALALIEKQDKMEQKKNYKTEVAKPQVAVQPKPQTIGQRVIFDQNGELLVLTNKGKLDAKGKQEVILDGIFTINARDLAKLLSMVSDVKFKEESYFRGSDGTLVTFFNPKKDVQDLIAEKKEMEKECCEIHDVSAKNRSKYFGLQRQIRDFNESRHFWERKLELEDNE